MWLFIVEELKMMSWLCGDSGMVKGLVKLLLLIFGLVGVEVV